jgi:hypothetical protein
MGVRQDRKLVPPCEIIFQDSPDFRAGITLNTCQDIDGSDQFAVSERWRIRLATNEKLPFSLAGMEQVKINFEGPLRVYRTKNFSAAVRTLHLTIIYSRFMRLAANPAPKPLSILTTVTPAAQELSIPRSAARPPKLAP